MPRLRNVPLVTNAVIALTAITCAVLLFGLPVERVLNVLDNPVSRVAVVTFAMSLTGLLGLGFGIHLLLHRHRRLEAELAEMRRLTEAYQASTDALAATADSLEGRLETAIHHLQDEMAGERERMRAQVRAYLKTQGGARASVTRGGVRR